MDYGATSSMYDVLERLLHDESTEPTELPLSLLRAITNDFADAQKIDEDGYFVIYYKGVLRNGNVIVKKLRQSYSWMERFQNEVDCHMRMRANQHKNIVRFLGYHRSDTDTSQVQTTGLSQVEHHRLLCFEYPSGGNLHTCITNTSCGTSWRERYKIIKGICEGLYYLHQNRIVHLNLNHDKIWFDKNNEPKIHDFSGSRLLDEMQSKVITKHRFLSMYKFSSRANEAPEFLENGVITLKTDIYSLGFLIIEILTGRREYYVLVKNILNNWGDRLGTSLQDMSLEQIRVCAEIAKSCLEHDPEKRPDAEHIIKLLVETESTDKFSEPRETESLDEFTEPDERESTDKFSEPHETESVDEFTEPDETESVDEFTESDTESDAESDAQTMELNILERILAGSEEPSHLDLSLLQSITENFSEQRKIGVGGCGEVYKGTLQNGDVAVKRLFKIRTIKDKMFHREIKTLITVRHHNIIRFLGYCSVTEEHALPFEGGTIMVDIRERLLCFEYISNGNLENHLTDELRGLEWHTRYEIIVGICKGLLYLHKEKDIIHMDLKPSNILLDDLMVPKITDFGLSRLDNNSQAASKTRLMSPGYCSPEYSLEGKSSSKSDIYSLGVMVRVLVTGNKKEPDLTKVLRRWRHRWIKSSKHTPLGYQQVTKCLKLAQRCIQINPTARPDIVYIMDELNTIENMGGQFQEIPCFDDMLGIEPLEIHFPFELDPQISHSIELTNATDDWIAFMMKARLRCFRIEPDKGIVPPRSKCIVTATMQAQVNALLNNDYKEEITVVSTRVDGGLAAIDITRDVFIEKEGTVVDKVNVMVVFDNSPSADEES